jgi:hypothetical protein
MEKLLDWIELLAMCGFMMFVIALFVGPFIFPVLAIITIKIFAEQQKQKIFLRKS